MQRNKFLLSGVALAAVLSQMPAQAQDAENEGNAVDRVLQKVTVSATKKQNVENVQDVPIAVTAFNSDTLDALNVNTVEDLSYSSPNVSLDDVGTSRGTANFAIRGLGVNSSIPSIDPAVGVFVDGVYLGINNGVVVDLFDLESVEVLRGPQGLLFGRNTTGGALVINTARPTDEFSYKARARFDGPIDDDRGGLNSTVQGIVSGPLIEDKLNGKIGAYYNTDAGYFKNQFDGDNHGEAQTAIYKGALEWFATDRLTFLLNGQYNDSYVDGPSGQNRAYFDRDSFDFSIDNPGFADSETIFGSLRTDYDVDFGNGQITNIFGYRSYEGTTSGDIDASPFDLFHSNSELDQEQVSNELRYAGTFGKTDLTTGLYYFNQTLDYTEIRDLLNDSAAPPPTFYGGGSQDHTVYGAFANVDYSITPDLIGTVGLRYSKEEKDADITYIRPRPECSVVEGTCPTTGINPFTGEENRFSDGDEWSNWTPKVGLQYFWTDNVQTYGTYTKGFRSGGYNFRITDVNVFLNQIVPNTGDFGFDEEEVDAFEIGFKSTSEDGRVQLNGAAFLTKISDMQREVNTAGPSGVVQNILNTADATIKGVELDGRWAATNELLFTFNVGMIDAEYDDVRFDISGDTQVDQRDENLELPRVPQLTYGFGAIHDADLGDAGTLVSTVNLQYRDRIAYTDSNFGWVQGTTQLAADLTWETPYEGFAVSLFGDNLLDEVQVGNDTQLPFPGPMSNGVQTPFQALPGAGTFSPLKKGRVVGIEFTVQR
ncbi:TonB-dependent receptor [Henriciella sp.]|uniref:TonB-dependent receptor n=1 Tax=Henriciella sp. TaxID=1968823 RepID=UPI002616B3A5|nr:TonB-dependent receptor [Henriciella sp.]